MHQLLTMLMALHLWGSPAQPKHTHPPTKPVKTMTMSATAYCQYGATADGSLTRRGVVAADTRVLPFGSLIRVIGADQPYSGLYRVSDSGSAIKGRSLDFFMPSCREAIQFGRQRVQVSVVRVGQSAN